jgi:hypothetical protein
VFEKARPAGTGNCNCNAVLWRCGCGVRRSQFNFRPSTGQWESSILRCGNALEHFNVLYCSCLASQDSQSPKLQAFPISLCCLCSIHPQVLQCGITTQSPPWLSGMPPLLSHNPAICPSIFAVPHCFVLKAHRPLGFSQASSQPEHVSQIESSRTVIPASVNAAVRPSGSR